MASTNMTLLARPHEGIQDREPAEMSLFDQTLGFSEPSDL